METNSPLYEYDAAVRAQHGLFCGVDEAGRGPLCGPVCCAAVILDPENPVPGVNDSKKLSEKKREELYEKIINTCLSYRVEIIDEKTIDRVNILNATKIGMENAANLIGITPDIVLIDAVKGLDLKYNSCSIIKADAKSYAVACASILAKVTRDRIMRKYDEIYPQYGFIKHKGYGTAAHIAAIKKYGPCEIHRRTFIGNFFNEQT